MERKWEKRKRKEKAGSWLLMEGRKKRKIREEKKIEVRDANGTKQKGEKAEENRK